MANNHTGNVQPSIDLEEHRSKNIHAKAVVLHGYLPGTDQYVPITATDNGDGSYSTKAGNLATIADDVTTSDVVYVGYAPMGSATSAAVWRIKKINTASYPITTWADGDDDFDNIFDNRTSLTYA